MTRNLAASVRARLKNHADAHGQEFGLVLTQYGLERLLYRLSISAHAPKFLLKGALLFSLWYDLPHRPTRDADLLGFGASDVQSLVNVFRKLCELDVDDGLQLDATSVGGSEIRKDGNYGGVRVELRAKLDSAAIKLQVDVGFGDAVIPPAEEIVYPVLLADMPAPKLRAYSKYTAIAEKLHASCVLGLANSRMKDYFDLHILARDQTLDKKTLASAIAATFRRRDTDVPIVLPVGLTNAFANNAQKQTQWNGFLKRNRLVAPELTAVVEELGAYFGSVLAAAATINDGK